MRKRSITLVLFLCLIAVYIPGCAWVTGSPTPGQAGTALGLGTSTPLPAGATLTSTPAAMAAASATAPATATHSLTTTPTATSTPLPPQVVVISIDGLRPDTISAERTPNLWALAHRGAFTWRAQTIYPSATLPAHASLLTGFLPWVHGVLWNDYEPARGTVTLPTMLGLAHAAGLRTVMIVGKEKFAHLAPEGTLDDYVFATTGDAGVVAAAEEQAAEGFGLMFVHLPNMDHSGHANGWMSDAYLQEAARMDARVGELLAALPATATVILTADHGGHGTSHGSRAPEDMTIPWMIAGPGVAPGHELTTPVVVVDTAATAAWALGLELPAEAEGRPVLEAYGLPAPDLLRGAWSEGARQAPARSEMPAVALDGLIYVPGGFGGETTFAAYDPAADSWTNLAPLPEGRHHPMAASLAGKVYVFGGAPAGGNDATTTTFVYDVALASWAEAEPMPEPRLGGAAVALDERLYVVGGVGGTAALLEYDPAEDAWSLRAPLPQPRDHVAVAVLDGEIYALGGRWQGVGELASVDIYYPRTNTWRAGSPLLRPHAGFSAATIGGRILVAGGEIFTGGSVTLRSFEVYDPRAETWSAGPDVPQAVHGVAAAAAGRRFYLLGGSLEAGAVRNEGRVWVYTP